MVEGMRVPSLDLTRSPPALFGGYINESKIMADDKREVNFSEEVKIDPEVPEEEIKEEDETSENEKETQEESSTQENQEEESEESEDESEDESDGKTEDESEDESEEKTDDTSDSSKKEPKPVDGETPIEKARRLEIQRLRRDLRDTRNQKVFEGYKPETKDDLSDDEKATLSQYDEKELNQFEKVIDVVAKKRGWVKKGDFQATTYQQQASDTLDGWLEGHKEYLPENDKDNLLWNQFQHEFSLYRKPDNPRDLKRIFDKAHREVFGISDRTNSGKINAQKEKVKVASHQGANQKSQTVQRQQSSTDPSLKEHLKGFTDEEKDEIVG